jgi:hypothetical protein
VGRLADLAIAARTGSAAPEHVPEQDHYRLEKFMTLTDAEQMWNMITGFWVSQLVRATARLSLADHLAKGPANQQECQAS